MDAEAAGQGEPDEDAGTDDSEPTPLDRVGGFMQDMSTVGQRMAQRNIELWNDLSNDVRGAKKFKAGDLADNLAKAMGTAVRNAQDGWDLFTRVPERETVAIALPTAFLLLDSESGQQTNPDPVWIRVPFIEDEEKLPKRAIVELGDGDQAEYLVSRLAAKRGRSGRAYKLEYSAENPLEPAVYTGIVYVDEPRIRPVANLRIVVK